MTPALIVKDAAGHRLLHARVRCAQAQMRMLGPDGTTVMHAAITIGGAAVILADATHKEDLTPDEIARRAQAASAQPSR